MNPLFKISEQTVWQIVGKIITSLSTLIILSSVTRKYGEEGTGIFTLVLTYLAIFYLLADFGFNAHVIKDIENKQHQLQIIWKKLLGTRLIISALLVLISLIVLPLMPFFSPILFAAISIGCLTILFNAIYSSTNLIFQFKFKYHFSSIAQILGTIIALLTIIVLISLNYGIPYLFIGYFFSWLIIAVTSLLFVKQFIKNIAPIFDAKFVNNLLLSSWPLALTLGINVVYFRLDSFILASLKSFTETGTYNLSYQIFQSVLVLPTFIMNSFYPLLLKYFKEDIQKFLNLFKCGIAVLVVISVLGTVFTYIFSPYIINILTGSSGFVDSTVILKILSLSFPAFFISSLLMIVLIIFSKYKIMSLIYLAGLIINTLLNILLIPSFSYFASAWLTVLTEYLILSIEAAIIYVTFKKWS